MSRATATAAAAAVAPALGGLTGGHNPHPFTSRTLQRVEHAARAHRRITIRPSLETSTEAYVRSSACAGLVIASALVVHVEQSARSARVFGL